MSELTDFPDDMTWNSFDHSHFDEYFDYFRDLGVRRVYWIDYGSPADSDLYNSPPYAPALEPLAVAAMVAQNRIDGVESVAPDEAWGEVAVLDVRSPEEAEESPAAHDCVIRIPLAELAERVGDLDATIRIVVCARGPRSAEAVRLLERHGIRARYLGGGLRWRESLGEAAGSRRTESVEET